MNKIFLVLMVVMFTVILLIPTNYVPDQEYEEKESFIRGHPPDCGYKIREATVHEFNLTTGEKTSSERTLLGGCKL